jgi:hypothetical protein
VKAGTHVSVALETQLPMQAKNPGKRENTSLIKEVKPNERKRSASGGTTSLR